MGPVTWPGCYDIYGITSDGGILCFSCMEKERRNIIDSISTKRDDGWRIVGVDATCNTDSEVTCEHCNTTLQKFFTKGS
jgi:hypothetical protein